MIFLSFPYSDPNPLVIRQRVSLAEKIAASMIKSGMPIISPVLHWHHLLQRFDIPTTYEYWERYCYDMLKMSDILFILMMDGWDNSAGIQGEIRDANKLGIKIMYHEIRKGSFKYE
jgi:hypothetical protein